MCVTAINHYCVVAVIHVLLFCQGRKKHEKVCGVLLLKADHSKQEWQNIPLRQHVALKSPSEQLNSIR